ncbi:unnamed protein product [Cuscuta epithymum]|uniref:Calmodulin-binding domain-containing protein n=1 Tax=Cuscuta epithymum TaxID=186058 RepID=A0AAV0E8Y1_9ASTE|nr:unnamed protein product [Cuscuta epithymum]
MATRVKEIGAKGKEKKGMTSPSASSHATHLDNVSQHKRSTTTSPKSISSSAASAAPSYSETKSSEAKKRMQPSVIPKRKPSLDKPPSHHLDSHPPNPAGDDKKPYLARRRSFDMSHSASSPTSQGRPTQGNKPSVPRATKYGLDKPQSSQTMPNSGAKGKVLRSSSSVGKSSSITTHHQVKSLYGRTTATNQLPSNKTRKQLGTTLSSRPRINKKQERITSNTNQDSSSIAKDNVAEDTEVFTKAIQQEKDNVLLTDDEELDDLTSYENGSLLDSEDNFDTFEEGNDDPEEITKLESIQESKETAQIEGDPHEDDEENKSTTTTETLPVAIDTKFADDDIPIEENSNEKILQVCDNIEEKQEKEEQTMKEIDDHQDDQELAEEVKETSENNNNVIDAPTETTHELSEVVRGTRNENVVSNDVIEETASKLREQRKNKVRALAGAFETVISLQEPK